jgi:hypothetical protein
MKAAEYLALEVNYGGKWVSIGWLTEKLGERDAAAWLAGYRLTMRIRKP